MIADNVGNTFLDKYWFNLTSLFNADEATINNSKSLVEREAIKDMRFGITKLHADIEDEGEIYKTTLTFTPLTSQSKTKLANLIRLRKNILPDINFTVLHEDFFNEIISNKIFLIPENKRSVKASCSCSNTDVCPHIIALIFASLIEIEKNPSLLFILRDFEIKKVFKGSDADSGIVKHLDLSSRFVSFENINAADFPNSEVKAYFHIDAVNILSIFKLLPEKPLFYKREDFRTLLLEKYKALAGFAAEYPINESFNSHSLSGTDFYLVYYSGEELNGKGSNISTEVTGLQPAFLVNKDIPNIKVIKEEQISLPVLMNKEIKLTSMLLQRVNYNEVLKYFLSVPYNIASDRNSVSSKFLNAASSVALMLIRNYAFIPQVRFLTDEEFIVSYCPLIANKSIENVLRILKEMTPPNLVIRKKDSAVYKNDIHTHLLSEFITYIINSYEFKFGRKHYFSDQKMYNAFFKKEKFTPEKYDEHQNGVQTALWLEKLSYINMNAKPVLVFRDGKEDEYEFYIEIRNKADNTSSNLTELFVSKPDSNSETLRSRIIRQLNSASELFPELSLIISSQGKEPGKLSAREMYEFMKKTEPVLTLLGVESDIPQEMKAKNSPQAVLTARLKNFSGMNINLDVNQLVEFEWQINIGDKLIPVDEYFKLTGQNDGLINVNGSYFINDPSTNEFLLDQVKNKIPGGTQNILKLLISGEFNGNKILSDANIDEFINSLFSVEETDMPENLNTELREYQISGFMWLYSKLKKGFGLCLADDMGLGKTVQVIATILKFKQERFYKFPILIICPTSLVANWYKEFERFAPSLKVFIYHGSRRRFELSKHDVLLTTYGIIRNETEKFRKYNWDLIILDEAQNIKNWESEQAKSVKILESKLHLALSGTPVENRLTELWSIFDFINKDYLGTYHHFKSEYAIPIEKYGNTDKLTKLRQITSPFVLRRLKSDPDVIDDLPDKIELDEFCYLTVEQRELYKKTISDVFAKITHARKNERSGFILNLITYLKQICNHPAQFTKEKNIDYRMSGKTEKMIDLVNGFLDRDEKALIFTQYKEMGQIICMMLRYEFNIKPLFFHGSLSAKKRDTLVEQFQNNEEDRIMIVSIKAGGTGLNLTAAERVIHFDLWWNPAVENQATDRTYRIGQEKKVTVHRLISVNTFEEKIDKMLKQKKELADLAVVSGEPNFSELSNKELKQLFKLD